MALISVVKSATSVQIMVPAGMARVAITPWYPGRSSTTLKYSVDRSTRGVSARVAGVDGPPAMAAGRGAGGGAGEKAEAAVGRAEAGAEAAEAEAEAEAVAVADGFFFGAILAALSLRHCSRSLPTRSRRARAASADSVSVDWGTGGAATGGTGGPAAVFTSFASAICCRSDQMLSLPPRGKYCIQGRAGIPHPRLRVAGAKHDRNGSFDHGVRMRETKQGVGNDPNCLRRAEQLGPFVPGR